MSNFNVYSISLKQTKETVVFLLYATTLTQIYENILNFKY